MTKEQAGKIRVYITWGTFIAGLSVVVWLIKGGAVYSDVCDIPSIRNRVQNCEKVEAVQDAHYADIKTSLNRIERKLDR